MPADADDLTTPQPNRVNDPPNAQAIFFTEAGAYGDAFPSVYASAATQPKRNVPSRTIRKVPAPSGATTLGPTTVYAVK